MITAHVLRDPLPQVDSAVWRADAPSFENAVSALLEGIRAGRVSATAPTDRWLVLRVEEALRGCDEIRQIATDDESAPLAYADGIAGTAVIRARRAWALD